MKVTFILLSTVATFFLSAVHALDAKKIKHELMRAQIIPDAFDEFEPTMDMEVTYDDVLLENGDFLQPELSSTAPHITFSPKSDTEYTVAMINLDSYAPQVVHWMTSNIKGSEIESGSQMASYKGPSPPAGSSSHRIVYALFEQEAELSDIDPLSERAFFDIKKFAADNKLKLVNAAYAYTLPEDSPDGPKQEIKQKGLLGNLLGTVGDLLGIDLGGHHGSYDDDGGLHIGIDVGDLIHIGVNNDRSPAAVYRSNAPPPPPPHPHPNSIPSQPHSIPAQPHSIPDQPHSASNRPPPPYNPRISGVHSIHGTFSIDVAEIAEFTPI